MAGRRAIAAKPLGQLQTPSVEDATTQRAFEVVTGAVQELQTKRNRDVVTANLIVGTNRIRHNLGRACAGYTLTPTTANATFAHAIDKTNPRPDLEVWITVIGVAQTAATIEVL